MGVTDNTALLATKQALVASVVMRELAFTAKLLQTVTDVSVHAKKGAKSVDFPKSNSFTVENRASGVAGTTQNLTYSTDQLLLNYKAHIQWLIEDDDAYQSNIEVAADYIKKAAAAHARNIDLQIIAILDANSGYQQAAGIDKTKILNAVQFLDQNHAMDEGRVLVIPPSDRNLMLQIADFVRADAVGADKQAISKGVIGSVYNCNVMVHAGTTKSFLYAGEGIAWAFQQGAAYGEQDEISFGNGSKLAVLDQLFGSKALRLAEGLAFDNVTPLAAGKSPFIAEIG